MTDFRFRDIVLVRRKKKKNIISEIYHCDGTLVKRFIKTTPRPDTRLLRTSSGPLTGRLCFLISAGPPYLILKIRS